MPPDVQDEPWDGSEEGVELIAPEDFLAGNPFPPDAQRMGIDRWSGDAGMLAVATNLDPSKRWHRVAAWVMLVAVLLPVLPYVLNVWSGLFP